MLNNRLLGYCCIVHSLPTLLMVVGMTLMIMQSRALNCHEPNHLVLFMRKWNGCLFIPN